MGAVPLSWWRIEPVVVGLIGLGVIHQHSLCVKLKLGTLSTVGKSPEAQRIGGSAPGYELEHIYAPIFAIRIKMGTIQGTSSCIYQLSGDNENGIFLPPAAPTNQSSIYAKYIQWFYSRKIEISLAHEEREKSGRLIYQSIGIPQPLPNESAKGSCCNDKIENLISAPNIKTF